MSEETGSTAESVTATVEFKVTGAIIRAQVTVPTGPTRISEMVETCRALTGVLVETAVEQAEKSGARVSCKAGCGACCRQVVPVSEPEARILAALVESMPEPRRTIIRERFAAARRRLEEAGLLEQLLDTDHFPYAEVRHFGKEYFELGIPCPFLEDEACSIYPDRPLICREYLVTSPAEYCRCPSADTIRMVPLSTMFSRALHRVGMKSEDAHGRWVPLIVALEWAAARPEEECEFTGPQLLEDLFSRLYEQGQKAPEPAESAADNG